MDELVVTTTGNAMLAPVTESDWRPRLATDINREHENETAPVAAGAWKRTNQRIRNQHYNSIPVSGHLELLVDALPPGLDPIRCYWPVNRQAIRVLGSLSPPRMAKLLLALVRDGALSAVGIDTNNRVHVAHGSRHG